MIRGIKRFGLAVAILLIAATAHGRSEGIYNPKANAVGDYQGIDSNSSSGGGAVSCAQSTAYFARKSGTTNNTALATYICGLVSDGVWSKLDALYIFAQDTQANSLLSLVSATFNATAINAPTWVAGGSSAGGFTGNGTTSYVDSNFNPNTASSPNFIQDSASLSVWSNTNTAAAVALAGTNANTGRMAIYTDDAGSAFFLMQDTNTYSLSVAVANGTGHYVVNRSSSTNAQGYKNGSSIATTTAQSSSTIALITNTLFGTGDTTFSNQQFMMGSIGGNLSSTDVLNLYSRTHTLLQTIAGIP